MQDGSNGWFLRTQRDPSKLLAFLYPKSNFLLKLISLQCDANHVYELDLESLPAPTKRLLLTVPLDLQALPQMYHDKIKSSIASSRLSKSEPDKQQHIVLTILEYYLFYFFNTFNAANITGSVDDSYFNLLHLYFMYFLPHKPAQIIQDNSSQSTPKRTPIRQYNSRGAQDNYGMTFSNITHSWKDRSNTDIFNTGQMIRPIEVSNFYVQCFIETCICQNERSAIRAEDNNQSVEICGLKYKKPNQYHLRGIWMFINHLFSLNISKVTAESQIQRMRVADINRQIEDVYEVAKGNAYRFLRPKLYMFLRLAFQLWPSDPTICDVVNIWITYLAPWKASESTCSFSEEWAPFVQENFLFYTRLFYEFLLKSNCLNLFDAARSNTSRGTSTQNLHYKKNNSLEVIEKVIAIYEDQKLVDFLKILENALCSLDQSRGGIMNHTAVPRGIQTPKKDTFDSDKADRLRSFVNSGPKTRSDIVTLEGSYVYEEIFSTKPDSSIMQLATKFGYTIQQAIVRLNYLKDSSMQSNNLISMFQKSKDISSQKHLDENIARLESVVRKVKILWNFDGETSFGRCNSQENFNEIIGKAAVAPNVFAPDIKEDGLYLTAKGREQIKRGIRKSTAEDIKVMPSRKQKLLIRDDEVEFLARFLVMMSQMFNLTYANLRLKYPLPPLNFNWLRNFANKLTLFWCFLVMTFFMGLRYLLV